MGKVLRDKYLLSNTSRGPAIITFGESLSRRRGHTLEATVRHGRIISGRSISILLLLLSVGPSGLFDATMRRGSGVHAGLAAASVGLSIGHLNITSRRHGFGIMVSNLLVNGQNSLVVHETLVLLLLNTSKLIVDRLGSLVAHGTLVTLLLEAGNLIAHGLSSLVVHETLVLLLLSTSNLMSSALLSLVAHGTLVTMLLETGNLVVNGLSSLVVHEMLVTLLLSTSNLMNGGLLSLVAHAMLRLLLLDTNSLMADGLAGLMAHETVSLSLLETSNLVIASSMVLLAHPTLILSLAIGRRDHSSESSRETSTAGVLSVDTRARSEVRVGELLRNSGGDIDLARDRNRRTARATARTTATNAAGTLAATFGEAIMHRSGLGDLSGILISSLLGQATILGLFGQAETLAEGIGASVLGGLTRHDHGVRQ